MLLGESVTSQSPDFYADLEAAIVHVTAQPSDEPPASSQHSNEADPDSFKDCTDDFVIQLEGGVPGPDTVYTTNPYEYLALIEQATEALHKHIRPEAPFDNAAYEKENTEMVEHEQAHGREMAKFGNEDTIVYYGVAFFRDSAGELQFQPHVSHSGPLRKIHEAWSALAPSHGWSDADLELPRRLGYDPADREQIRLLAEATPPLEPGWRPPQLGIDPESADTLAALLQQMDFSDRDK